MKKWEKLTLIFLLLIIAVCSGLLAYHSYLQQSRLIPAYGGTYTEGIVADNKAEIDQVVKKLTSFGLTYFDNQKKLQPGLAEKWEISEDGKSYTFYLREGIDSHKIAETIKFYKNGWDEVEIQIPDEKTIQFILKQAYSPFLASTAEPMFDYGPYKLEKQDKKELVFKAREDFFAGQPYLEKIIIKLYPDQENLAKAVRKDDLLGLAKVYGEEARSGFKIYEMSLPRYLVLFFNLNQEQFQDKEIRQKIKKEEKLDQEIQATLVTNEKEENLLKAEELKAKWEAIGLKIEILPYDSMTLQKEIIPNRDYDLLLYGIDYGYDPDPYPFWHTSQMAGAGLNLSSFSDQKADAYLEEARQTTDETARQEKYQKFQEILDDEVPAIFLEQVTIKYEISEKIKGIESHDGFILADRFNEVWKWYIRTHRVRKS